MIRGSRCLVVVVGLLAWSSDSLAQPGNYLFGNGAVQGGMAGVSTATPLDALGALYWNPAAIGRLGRNEVSIGGVLAYPDIYLSASRPRLDGSIMSGRTRSDSGLPLLSSLGVVYQLEEGSPMALGFGLLTLGGGGVNFPGDPNNPALSPTGPLGQVVIGSVFSSLLIVQMNPTVSYQVTDRLVVGVGPTIDITVPSFEPAFFAMPNQVPDAPNTIPSATNARPYWGGGFRAGLVYSLTDTLDAGFGYTSPQWLETWRFNARDNLGNPQTLTLNASLPAIYSWGLAWRGIQCLTLGVDMRYFDYANADLFGQSVRDGGLGWDSAFAVAVGGDYQVNERVSARLGYQYNTNPLADTSTLFNMQSPSITQNTITCGTTVGLTDALSMSVGYAYGFQNSITGTISQVPNARVELETSTHALLFGMQIKFGGCGRKSDCPATASAYDAASLAP